MSSDASPQHSDTDLRKASTTAGHVIVRRLLAASLALLLVIAVLLCLDGAGRRAQNAGAAPQRSERELAQDRSVAALEANGIDVRRPSLDGPQTRDFSAPLTAPAYPLLAALAAADSDVPMVRAAAVELEGAGDRQNLSIDGTRFLRSLAPTPAALALDPPPEERLIPARISFLTPFNASLGPDGYQWDMPAVSEASGTFPRMGWVLALAVALLSLAAIYSALLRREAERRASITAALQASERKLREQLSFNESLLHGLPVPVFVKDAAGRYFACNDAFAGTVGLARSSILGRAVEDILPPKLSALHREMDGAALSQWRDQQYEAESAFGGALSHWLICKSPFTVGDKVGDKVGVIGVALDISDRRRAEEALKRSHQFFERTLNTIPQPVFVKNFQHRFVFVNDAACLYLGFSREQMLGRTDHDLFPIEQADKFAALDDLVFATGESNLEEAKITDAGGAEHVVLITKAVFDDDAGRPVLVGVITDITERKRAEELLQIGAEVFEHSSEGIMITDDRARILMVNDAFVRITGLAEAEVLGRNARVVGSEQLSSAFFRSVYRRLKRHGCWKGEVVNRRRNGELYVVEMPVCAVRDDAGRVLRYIAMLTDITQRKHSEARVSYLAEHDFLTGLANRALLHDRAEQALIQAQRSGRKVAALLLDLDDFKLINDTWGHAVGDLLVQHVAQCLTAVVRESDTVARFGGDEFVVLLPDMDERGDSSMIALAISSALAKPFKTDSLSIHVGVSCGIAVYPDDAANVDGLFRAADAAMYRAKQRSRPDTEASAPGVRPGIANVPTVGAGLQRRAN